MLQDSVLRPLFLIYINDPVVQGPSYFPTTRPYSVVHDLDIAADKLNRDHDIISDWAHQWKMQFDPDKSKQGAGPTDFDANHKNFFSVVYIVLYYSSVDLTLMLFPRYKTSTERQI